MRQVQIDRFGSVDELHVREAEVPVPGHGEVLVRLQAAGTNPIDYKMRDGSSGAVKGLTDPLPGPAATPSASVPEAVTHRRPIPESPERADGCEPEAGNPGIGVTGWVWAFGVMGRGG